ncbi:lycopene beta-cyclase CrtY [Sphingomonas sp.]|uniref:lycopene beta-cyclase CrtY n=1 Tax=Sphingomonas sp. TaxID=28214 RepID=UPI001B2E6B69|nr:lycopene beta-cyclase CrtY [Sphingomonas sp.]MBO9714069.1 lycopene beta-cyclase CrtY [Sphingomonas sp.]
MPAVHNCDVAIVGGGLAGGLIALALARHRPDCEIRLVESGARLGGNHLWSFFATDVAAADRWLVAPLVSYGWTRYDVAFPAHRRTLHANYYSIESERFDRVIRATLPERSVMLRRKALAASSKAVVLADGDRIEARGVIDCRGPGDLGLLELGWQKFYGCEFRLGEAHDLPAPLLMDATVAQHDGYRFVYCLPFAATRMFVEDTYYSDTPDLDVPLLAGRVQAYAESRGWEIERVERTEGGALPVALGGDFEAYWQSGGNKVAKAGMRAGLFHPMTGYSLPDAVRTAMVVAKASDHSAAAIHDLLLGFARRTWKARAFYRMLAAMLFKAADPDERYRVLERFYRLDPRLVARFYAGQTTMLDRARILSGRPPVPVGRAIQAMGGRR